jgi:hypothetical protein
LRQRRSHPGESRPRPPSLRAAQAVLQQPQVRKGGSDELPGRFADTTQALYSRDETAPAVGLYCSSECAHVELWSGPSA